MVQPLLRTIFFSVPVNTTFPVIIQLQAFQLEELLVLYQLKFSFNTSKNMTLCRISVGLLKKSLVPLLNISFLMINNLVCILGNEEVDFRRMADVSGAVYLSSIQRYSDGDYRSSTCSGSYKSCGVYQSVWQAIPRSHFSGSFTAPPPTTQRAARGAFLPWTFSAALGARVPAVDPKGMNVLFARLSVRVSTCCMLSTIMQGGEEFTSTPFHTP